MLVTGKTLLVIAVLVLAFGIAEDLTLLYIVGRTRP